MGEPIPIKPDMTVGVDGGGDPPDSRGVEHRLTALETRLDTVLPTLATRADLGDIKVGIEGVRSDLRAWMLATVLTVIATVVGAIVGMATLWKSPVQQPTTTPIVIQLPPSGQPSAAPAPAQPTKQP